jgi:hypothetical protein
MRAEARDLRVMAVALRLPLQHGAREQRFAPKGDEPLWIQVPRMQRPESQARPTVLRRTPIFSSSHSMTSPGFR